MLQIIRALLPRDKFWAFTQNSQIRILLVQGTFSHNLDVPSKTLQCVGEPGTFQPGFLYSDWITCLEHSSLEEILIFLHGLTLTIPFLHILLYHHAKVALWVPIAQGFKCSYLLPLSCHLSRSAHLEGRAGSLLKVPAHAQSGCPTCIRWCKWNTLLQRWQATTCNFRIFVCPLCSFPLGDVFRVQSITLSQEKSGSHWIWGGHLKKHANPRGKRRYESFCVYIIGGMMSEKIWNTIGIELNHHECCILKEQGWR